MNNVVSNLDESFPLEININKQTPNPDVLVSKILSKILNTSSMREVSFEPLKLTSAPNCMVMKIRIPKWSNFEDFGIQSTQLDENVINILSDQNEESKEDNCVEINSLNNNLNQETNAIQLENCVDIESPSDDSSDNLSNNLNLAPNEHDAN